MQFADIEASTRANKKNRAKNCQQFIGLTNVVEPLAAVVECVLEFVQSSNVLSRDNCQLHTQFVVYVNRPTGCGYVSQKHEPD